MNLQKIDLKYLIAEGFVAVFVDENGIERFRLKTKKEIQEEIEIIKQT